MQLQDDTNKMTREDIMRELELLPVWQLKPSVNQQALPLAKTNTPESPALSPENTPLKRLKSLLLVDLPAEKTQEAELLLANIVLAIKKLEPSIEIVRDKKALQNYATQTMLIFGQETAQDWLGLNADNAQTLMLNEQVVQVHITHSLATLLQNGALKAQVWQTICQLFIQQE
jgi:uracil-DNA glycosylase